MSHQSELRAQVVETVDDIPSETWNSLAPPDDPVWSWNAYRALERGVTGPAGFRYVVVREGDRIVAIQPAFLMPDYALEETAGPRTRSFTGAVRRVWPRFMRARALFCGHPLGQGMCLRGDDDRSEVTGSLLARTWQLMRDEGLWMLVLKDFFPDHADTYLGGPGGERLFGVPALPDTVLSLDFDDFEGWLKTLKSSARRNARSKLRKFEAGPAEYELRADFGPWIPAMYALYEKVWERADVRLEKLTPSYFEAIARDPEVDAEVLACLQDGELIAFALCLYGGGRATNLRMGQDYERAQDAYAYFILHYETLRRALERGCSRVHFCQTTYHVKLEMGCRLVDCVNVVSHRNPLARALYRRALRQTLRSGEEGAPAAAAVATPHPATSGHPA